MDYQNLFAKNKTFFFSNASAGSSHSPIVKTESLINFNGSVGFLLLLAGCVKLYF